MFSNLIPFYCSLFGSRAPAQVHETCQYCVSAAAIFALTCIDDTMRYLIEVFAIGILRLGQCLLLC